MKYKREEGQGTLEYAAVIVAAAVLVLVLILLATPWGKKVGCEIQSALDKMLGGPGYSCSDIEAEDDSHKPTEPCVLSESAREKAVSGTIIITVEGGGRIGVEKMSDGTYRVTQTGILDVGYQFNTSGISVSGTRDDKTVGISQGGADAGAEVGVSGEASSTFIVDSEEEKDKLVDYLQNQVDTAVVTTVNPIFGGVKWVWDWGWDTGGARTYSPPEPAEKTYQLGADAEVNVSASGGGVKGEASVGGAAALGVTTHNDGTATYYYSASAYLDASGELSFDITGDNSGDGKEGGVDTTVETNAAHAGVRGEAENLIAVTVDESGNPTSMSMTTVLYGEADAGIADIFGGDDYSWKKGGGKVYENTIDMTDPRSADVGYDLMLAAGIPVYGVAKTAAGDNPYANFLQEARDNGVSTRRDITAKDGTTNVGIEAIGRFGAINLGFGYEDETTSVEYGNGEYWNGNSWADWGEC
ncbi:hypothetical protein [Actinomyces sp.]|uniref:hypothetical protein n=1 Tax=Actinomyces sp. TaxID=29317 RepID=UPI0026DCB10C|nr:hypothetical protein [Actinomyces sp.]MDO4901227.1 hypothetical protein [Actinomyces sp.]